MRKIRRTRATVAAALVTLALSVAACSSNPPELAPPPSPPAEPSSANAPDGVTTPAQAFGPACQQLPQNGVPGSAVKMASMPVAAAAKTNPLLSQLDLAVQKAGLVDTLNQAKSATVFAPYDDAFANLKQQLGPDRFNALLADKNSLADILKYHVVVKRYDRAALTQARSVTTLQGGSLMIKDDGDTMDITDNADQTAHVLCGNLPTANATVFLIDKVLLFKRLG